MLKVGIFISVALHLGVIGLVWGLVRDNHSTEVIQVVTGINWEVEAEGQADPPGKKSPSRSAPTSNEGGSEPPAAASIATGTTGSGGPNRSEVNSYLQKIRNQFSEAIQNSQIPKSFKNSEKLILKIVVTSDGGVILHEIEKSSGNSGLDQEALKAFESILPLQPFPKEWNKNPNAITVRLPVEMRERTR